MSSQSLQEKDRIAREQLPSPLHSPDPASNGRTNCETPIFQERSQQTGLANAVWMQRTPNQFSTPQAKESSNGQLQTPGGHRNLINAELARHTHHLSPNPLQTLPPVEPSRQLASSPLPSSDSSSVTPSSKAYSQAVHGPSTSALQTPPPSISSRKQGSSTMTDSRKFSSNARSLMPPPETPGRHVQPSPQFFPSLQFSPDLYQFPMSGPATAPALPQQKLFWDPSTGSETEPASMQYHDPFANDNGGYINSMFPSPNLDSNFQGELNPSDQQPYDLPGSSTSGPNPTSVDAFIDRATFPAPFTTSPRKPPFRTEDPSLFLSSPARRFGGTESSKGGVNRSVWDKPAYHHQIEESKRERELERARKAKSKRLSGVFPVAETRRPASPAREIRPGLKRSLTHTGVGKSHLRNQSHVSFADSASNASNISHKGARGGRSSPVKMSRNSLHLASSVPRQRTSLTLSIDEDGHAKTIITKVNDPASSFMDLDEESSSGGEADSVNSSDFHFARSGHNSFAFSDSEQQSHRSSQPLQMPRSHSKTSSYSNFAPTNTVPQLSWAVPRTAGGREISFAAEQSQHDSHPTRLASTNRGSFRLDPDAMDEDGDNVDGAGERGNAQQALRAIIKERPQSRSTHDGSLSGQGSASLSQFNSSPPVPQTSFGAFNASPTTITDPDAITPSTDRESLGSNSSTRCICNSTSSDGFFMIQCESCSKWLHAQCVKVDPRNIPRVFVCPICIQTPMRHGRIREPSRASAYVPASPLAHKSLRFR